MSRRQIQRQKKHGTIYNNRKFNRLIDKLIEKNPCCHACGGKNNLEPHHILKCHVYDELFYDINNCVLLCKSCHDNYHGNYFPINQETFDEFCKTKHQPKSKPKKQKNYKQRKHYLSPDYTKIKINDFKATKKSKNKKRQKKNRRRKNKKIWLNPIYIDNNLGSDEYEFIDIGP